MAILKIPEELLPAYIEFLEVGLSVLAKADYELSEEEAGLYDLLTQLIENNRPHPCIFCGSENCVVDRNERYYWIKCRDCGGGGPTSLVGDGARAEWRNTKEASFECCPWCLQPEDDWDIEKSNEKFYVLCACEASGPTADTPEEAEELWKNRTR
jgi:hypothetical protein